MSSLHRWLALPLLLAAAPARAQDFSMEELLRMGLAKPGPQPWILVLRGDEGFRQYWMAGDDVLARLRADQDLQVRTLDAGLVAKVWATGHWSRAVAALVVRRDLKEVEPLTWPLSGAGLIEPMEKHSYRTVWQRREAFLQEHADHGGALAEKLATALAMVETRLRRKVERNPDQADAQWQEVAETLEALAKLPDPWRMACLPRLCRVLEASDPCQSPRMRGLLTGLRSVVLEAWQRQPLTGSAGLGTLWVTLERCLEGQVAALPDLLAPPGAFWPRRHDLLLNVRPLWARGDWRGLVDFLARVPDRLPDALADSGAWADYLDLQVYRHFLAAFGQARLGAWKEADLEAMACRRWAGKGWPALAEALKARFKPGGNDALDSYLATLGQEPLPEWLPPAPRPAPRVLHRTVPDAGFEALRQHPAFDLWAPGELAWGLPTAQETLALRDWGAGDWRWAALEPPATLIGTGTDLIRPQALAGLLAAVAPPRLARLQAFIQHDPGHLDARRKRAQLVRNRMPLPSLEPWLAEDVIAAQIPVQARDEAGWHPDPRLWEARIGQALPELEQALARWPGDAGLWRTWVSWAPLQGYEPPVADFVRALPDWGPKGALLARLPREVHEAVLRQAVAAARPEDAVAWFREAWHGLAVILETLPPTLAQEQVMVLDTLGRRALAAARPGARVPASEDARKALLDLIEPEEPAPAQRNDATPLEQATDLPDPDRPAGRNRKGN